MGCCQSKPANGGSHHSQHQQIPVPPDVNGTASASFDTSLDEVRLQPTPSDGKRSNGLVVENNNVAAPNVAPSVDVDALDGIKHPSQVSTIGIQTENWYPKDTSGKMPLLNNSSRSVVLGMEGDRGLENLGFQGSSASLIQEPRVDTSSSSSAPMTAGLDERQKTLVENTWKTLEKNTELYGSIMFAKLTTDHPDIGKLFPFGGKNLTYGELLVDPDVRVHGKRVIETLGSVVEDLDDMELVIQILEDLGQRHNAYNAKKTHIIAVGGALLFTIEEALGAGFTPEVKAAWAAVYNIVSDTMSTKLSGGPLTAREQELVQKTWGVLSLDTEQHGAAMFAKLISVHPAVAQMFPFGENLSYSQLVQNPTLRAHGKRVMETIGQTVGSLDDLDILVPILRDLARRHEGYSVTRQHFEPVGEALMHAIQEGLGRSFSEEVERAWLAVFKLVVDTMSDMLPEGPKEVMSTTQKRLIQDTWKKLSKDPERHGSVMFAKLTTSYPEVGKVFPFGGKGFSYEQLLRNRDVKAHGRRVFETVGQAINGLNDLNLLMPTLKDLAQRHVGYNVQKRYFVPTGEAFLHAVRLGVGPSSFTSDVRDAWAVLFKVVTDPMAEVVPDGPITATHKSLVQKSWKTIGQDPTKHGSVMFAKLITDNPHVGKLFPFGSMNLSYDQLLANKDLGAHGKRIIDTIGVAVSGLDDLELLIPILQDLAKRHVGYNVTKQHFKPVGGALIHALRQGLGSRFTPELEAAWTAVYSVVADTMSPLLPAGGLTTEQKNLIKGSWRSVAPEKAKCGAVMFAKLVTEHPHIGRLFPFGGLNKSYQSLLMDDKVKAHGLRVMQTISDAIRVLDNLDKLLPLFRDLGKRHVAYGVTKEHFAAVGRALINSLKETLGSSFNDNTKNAWLTFWQLIEDTMSEQLVAVAEDGLITRNQKEIVQRTWKMLEKDPGRHGAVMFARLLTDHPDVGHLFPFGNKGLSYHQLLWDDTVKAHGKKVMQTVGHAVDGLNDLDVLVPILQDLARRHIEYNVNRTHFEPVGKALLYAIEKGIGNTFDNETKEAWMAVFSIIVNTMSEILPSSTEEGGPLTREQKRLVKTTWKKLATNPTKHGAVMFAKLTTENPDVGHMFPFGGKNLSYQQLLKDPQAQAHGKRVMETVGTAVDGLDDLDLLVPILRELATRHVGYKVTKQHFKPVGAALIHAIKEGLGSSYSTDIQSAWVAVFQLITDTMSDVLPNSGPLTSAQKELVKRTWQVLAPNPAKHGAVMFAQLTTENPDVGHLFPFGGKNLSYQQLLKDPQAQAHGKRVMETVGTAVDGLDDLDLLVPILRELAMRHVGYKVTKQHFSAVGAALIHAIKEGLGSSYSPDIQSAWVAVFQLITDTMSDVLPDSGPLTSVQKELVKKTWQVLAPNPVKHGAVMFAKLTTENPDVGHLFPFGGKNLSYQQLLKDPQAQAHGKRVMETVGTAVEGLDDLDLLVPILQELATRHIGYKVTKQHFSAVGAALIHAIKEGLGSSYSPDIQGAWVAVFQLITNTMSDVLPDSGPLTSAQKELVKRTWQVLAPNPAKHGAVMFAKLLTRHPNVGKLFPFGKEDLSYEQLLKHAQVQAHGKKVMEKVGDAVDGLDDLDLLVPILKELGGRHVGYGVNKQLFEPVGEVLLETIKEALGDTFNEELRLAWTAVFKIISDTMSEPLNEDGSITAEHKRLVQKTWTKLSSNPAKHGATMFSKLVTDYPAVGTLLPFGNEGLSYDQLLVDPRVRAHGTKVMQTVGSAVDRLNDLESVVPLLQELATRHISYGVTKQHFSPVVESLMHAIKQGLDSDYNNDVEKSWLAVLQVIVDTMSAELPDGSLDDAKINLVRETWVTLSTNPEQHGAVMFAKLVTDNPTVGRLFPFGKKNLSYDQLLVDPQVKSHGKRVMDTVGHAVAGLDDLDLLVPILEELAQRHHLYGVTKKNFKPVGDALMHAIEKGLGQRFTTEVEGAWKAVFTVITNTMSKILPENTILTQETKQLVKESWKILSTDPGKHGAVMFARLTTQNPIVGRLFPFGDKNLSYGQLLSNRMVREHGTKVMKTIGQAVDTLDNVDNLVSALKDLGLRHTQYGVTKMHFEPVGQALIYAIKEGLGQSFTSKVKGAWSSIFQLISETMSEELPEGPISSNHIELLKRTWKVLGQNPEQLGAVLFAKLASDHPLVSSLFPFGGKGLTYDQLLQNDDVKKHGRQFMATVGNAIENLENHEILIPMFEDLAKRHAGFGVTRQHIPFAGEALLYAISDALGQDFTDDVRQAWETVFQLIVDVMSAKLPDGKKATDIDTMTKKQRELVESTWEMMASAPDKHGAVMFAKLVSDNPKVGRLFPFGKKKYPYKKLLNENEVISHGERFMTTLGQVVGGLDDPEFLVPMLHQLATRHSGYGVTKELFLAVKSALMFTLKQGLGKSVFSGEVQEAWAAAYQFIEDSMCEKL
ncbi:uncharacterized protein LOC763287 isoform X2 [Strongylocentrotus purpuratus]|uniref:Globin domain-containing protein n=1 Tax=Strongylocentrotus purpuratus TaxID=7668 RepID=A0A7M7HNK1_STRPU|nr:uncharacterized protein LOC763287 isoform X2 [Strongylocentrotus purpuratus]